MDLRQLNTFRHAAHTLSFSQTASDLDYAQSTVSAQIQALEKELDVALFDRLGKRVLLTEAGRRLLIYADRFQLLEEEARASLRADQAVTGTLTIYAPCTLCVYRLPIILDTFRRRHPQVKLNIHANIAKDAVAQVRDGDVDIAFELDAPITVPEIAAVALITEPMVFVTYPDHPYAGMDELVLTDLKDQPLVLTETTCQYRRSLEQMALDDGILLDSGIGFENVEAIKQCIRAGLGVSFLPRVAVAKELEDGSLVELPWSGTPLTFETQMIWHQARWLSPALTHFIEVVKEVYGV